MVFLCQSAHSYETSFPFPFEFGHSSDIYLNVQKPNTTKQNEEKQRATELLEQKKISTKPDNIVKYIKQNDTETIDLLIKAGWRANSTLNANSPVYYAAKYNSYEVLKLLLENGAKPNSTLSSPLRIAIIKNHTACATLLIESGSDVNYYDELFDETILYTALKKKEYAIAKLLIEKGAKPDLKSARLIKKNKLDEKYGINLK